MTKLAQAIEQLFYAFDEDGGGFCLMRVPMLPCNVKRR